MGVPFVGFPLYKYVVGGVEGDCRNIFHERFVYGFLPAVLEMDKTPHFYFVFWFYETLLKNVTNYTIVK